MDPEVNQSTPTGAPLPPPYKLPDPPAWFKELSDDIEKTHARKETAKILASLWVDSPDGKTNGRSIHISEVHRLHEYATECGRDVTAAEAHHVGIITQRPGSDIMRGVSIAQPVTVEHLMHLIRGLGCIPAASITQEQFEQAHSAHVAKWNATVCTRALGCCPLDE